MFKCFQPFVGVNIIITSHSQVDTLPMEPVLPTEAEQCHVGQQLPEKNPPEEMAKLDAHPNRYL